MNEESTQQLLRQILQQLQEHAASGQTSSLFLNQLNTEVARMTVELKHVADQQKSLQDHDKRLAVLEANAAQHEKFEQKLAEQNRAMIGMFIGLLGVGVTVVVAIVTQVMVKH